MASVEEKGLNDMEADEAIALPGGTRFRKGMQMEKSLRERSHG